MRTPRPMIPRWLTLLALCLDPGARPPAAAGAGPDAVQRLAEEVRDKGAILFCARASAGDWDLFSCRPDGSGLRNLTHTPQYNEAAPQLARDGRRLLFRRLPVGETIDNNRFGEQGELVVARADATGARALGESGAHAWASWSPDGTQIACLSIKGVAFVDPERGQVLRTLPRKGFFQQLTWSPDGTWLSGVANSYGTGWSVAVMAIDDGAAHAVHRVDCCTPDWFPDSQSLIFSWRPPGQKANNGYGWTQLWRADLEGTAPRLVYGEDGRHVYGGCVSPDGKYALFTGNMEENGDPGHAGAPMGLVRLADAPIVAGSSAELRQLHPAAAAGPVLALPAGWEPCWTSVDLLAAPPAR